MHAGLGAVYYEWNELDRAASYLRGLLLAWQSGITGELAPIVARCLRRTPEGAIDRAATAELIRGGSWLAADERERARRLEAARAVETLR